MPGPAKKLQKVRSSAPPSLVKPKLEKFLLMEYLLKNFPRVRSSLLDLGLERSADMITISLFSNKPGILIGSRGDHVRQIREMCAKYFRTQNVSIKIQEVTRLGSAQTYADEISRLMSESNLNPARICSFIQNDIRNKHRGVLGTYIKISGKFRSGGHARTTIFRQGEMKYSGNVFDSQVEEGVSSVIPTLGVIGIKVRMYNRSTIGRTDRLIFRSAENVRRSNNQSLVKEQTKPITTVSLFDTESDMTKETRTKTTPEDNNENR